MRLNRFLPLAALASLLPSAASAQDWSSMPGAAGLSGSPWSWAMPGMSSPQQQAGSALSGMAEQLPEWANSAAQTARGLQSQAAQSVPGFIPWGQGAGVQPNQPWSPGMVAPPQADLTGTWRGSGGEHVEIRRNVARVWGGEQQYCDCLFMIHGNRLIAYSPDTDVVRKYEFASARDRFALRDERGETMIFMRVR